MDIELHCTCEGEGAPLILLHGNGENGAFFTHQLEEFSSAFTVCALDTRGHGLSPRGEAPFTLDQFADDLLDFMDSEEIDQADLLGFSDGANIALLFALRYPERVHRLILNSANLYPEGLTDAFLDTIVPRLAEIGDEPEGEELREAELLSLMVNEPHIHPSELRGLTMPVLVIAGDRDLIRLDHTLLIAQNLPHSRLCILPGGHGVAAEYPDAFNQALWAFFRETDEEEGGF